MTRNEFIAAALENLHYPSDQIHAALSRTFDANPQQEEYTDRDLEWLKVDITLHPVANDF